MEMNTLYIFIAFTAVIGVRSEIAFSKDNGYEGIKIIVGDHLEQHENFIPALEELIQNASSYMHAATGQFAYIGHVTVVVPSHWDMNDTANVTVVDSPIPMSSAHIRIDVPNPKYKNAPYTLQPGVCGEPGKYIHLTRDFVLNLDGAIQEDFGENLGRQLVHEWAHYRYGVFDEYGEAGSKIYPSFYLDGKYFRPVTCEEDVPGVMESIDGGECFYEDILHSCVFRPDEQKAKITSSIMYLPYIPTINQFCDDSGTNTHNFKAPSQQNIKCGYTSTWAVIAQHKDFSNPQVLKIKKTQVQIMQPNVHAEPRFVVVMDYSSSMKLVDFSTHLIHYRRIDYLLIAVKQFLSSIVPDNSQVALIEFSNSYGNISQLTKIDKNSRKDLIGLLKKPEYGSTCIGCGLRGAISALSIKGQNPAGGTIILITDGENNIGSGIPGVLDEIIKAKVTVNTVAFGKMATANLQLLTKETGGNSFYFSGSATDFIKLDQAFAVSVHSQTNIETAGIQLWMKSHSLAGKSNKTYSIYVDPSLGNDTRFVVSGTKSITWISSTLVSPHNKTYTETNTSIFKFDSNTYVKTFTFPSASPGTWKFTIKNTNTRSAVCGLKVISKMRHEDATPIVARCWLNSKDVDLKKVNHVVVFCHVQKGYDAVIKAKVTAKVHSPNGVYTELTLFDDGSGADNEADDGIYSTYFTKFQANNRYSIVGTVWNDGKAKVLKGTSASSAPKKFSRGSVGGSAATKFPVTSMRRAPPGYVRKPRKAVTKTAENFQRSVTVDSFLVENVKYFKPNSIPPSRVTDLKVVSSKILDDKAVNVTIIWSSVGDNYDAGQAKSLDIRYSTNYSMLLKNFTQSMEVSVANITSGSLTPLQPHQTQSLDLHLKDASHELTLYFALKTIDHDGNAAPLSNIAEALIIDPSTIPQYTLATTTEKSPSSNSKKTLYLAVFITLGCVLLASVVGIVFYRKRRKSSKIIAESTMALN